MNFAIRRNMNRMLDPMPGYSGEDYPDEEYPQEDYFDDEMENEGYDDYRGNWAGPRGNMRGGWGGFPPTNIENNMGPGGFAWGRGFGPGGPPSRNANPRHNIIRYLMNCGLPRDQLNNLPNDLLMLIQPEFCGLCNVILDSYYLSRSHYVSKLHSKNQNKWLYPQRGAAFQRTRSEIPMKSRDLYCELCDVHITSKSHADSHYSGKPHRAVVEGRKNPKNANLLRKNMAARLEQLIRREKKHLKNVKETEKPEEVTVQEKPVSSELYCEICKAPVTCSEQMTIHLNGKRHLSKEKRYILNMMKGNTDDDKQKPDDEANKDGEDDVEGEDGDEGGDGGDGGDTAQEEGNKPASGNDYDWGNGSGTWDDDPQ